MSFTNGDRVRHINTGSIGTVTDNDYGYVGGIVGVDFGGGEQMVYNHDLELLSPEEVRKLDLEQAEKLLKKHGYAFRIYGPEDVHKVLDAYMNDNTSGTVDTLQHRDEITKHVMEGDDWGGVIDTDDSFSYIWDVVEGTQHGHPEWFPMQEQEDPFAGTTTLALVDRYATLRAVAATTNEGPATFVLDELDSVRAELNKRLRS